jgi:tryptophanyl-tRNA synthetase
MKQIDPWASADVKDYNKLMRDFGIRDIDAKKLPRKHHYFTRKIIFGEKGLQPIADAIKKKKRFAMLTGLMPSGKFHFGHKIITDLMIYFQSLGGDCYITVADVEAHLTRGISIEECKKVAIEEYLLNYIALGLKPKKHIFISKVMVLKHT